MQEKPLVSVVVPAFNRAAAIGDCLRSVQVQTYQNWEVIVVDDGSVDGTAEVVTQLGAKDSRIRLLRQDHNRGAQAARNAGIRAARGEWIAFLDSDDLFLPCSLERRLEVAIRERVSVVHSACNIVEADGRMKPYGIPSMAGQAYRTLLQREGPVFPGLFVSKRALETIDYLDERIVAFQEWDTAIRLAKYYSFGFEAKPTFIYDRRNSSNAMSRDMLRGGRGYEQVFHKHYLEILRHAGPRALARHYRLAARWYKAGGDQRAARRCNLTALLWTALDPKAALERLGRFIVNFR